MCTKGAIQDGTQQNQNSLDHQTSDGEVVNKKKIYCTQRGKPYRVLWRTDFQFMGIIIGCILFTNVHTFRLQSHRIYGRLETFSVTVTSIVIF